MHGLCIDTNRAMGKNVHRYRTPVAVNNGLNPRYEAKPIEFHKIIFPELAVMRIAMYEDKNNVLLAQRVLPVLGLRPGYR